MGTLKNFPLDFYRFSCDCIWQRNLRFDEKRFRVWETPYLQYFSDDAGTSQNIRVVKTSDTGHAYSRVASQSHNDVSRLIMIMAHFSQRFMTPSNWLQSNLSYWAFLLKRFLQEPAALSYIWTWWRHDMEPYSTMNFQWKKRFREMALWACAVARVPGKLCQFA